MGEKALYRTATDPFVGYAVVRFRSFFVGSCPYAVVPLKPSSRGGWGCRKVPDRCLRVLSVLSVLSVHRFASLRRSTPLLA